MKHAVVDSQGRPIFEGLPDEVRKWLRENEWALMFDVRMATGTVKPATVYMGRREA